MMIGFSRYIVLEDRLSATTATSPDGAYSLLPRIRLQ